MKVTINGSYPLVSDTSVTSKGLSWDKMMENGKVNQLNPENGIMDLGWIDFLKKWKEEGFWQAMYDKSFFEVCKDFLVDFLKEIGLFIMGNGDLFFLLPAVGIISMTFFIGRNRFTKFILPLVFGYFIASVGYRLL